MQFYFGILCADMIIYNISVKNECNNRHYYYIIIRGQTIVLTNGH